MNRGEKSKQLAAACKLYYELLHSGRLEKQKRLDVKEGGFTARGSDKLSSLGGHEFFALPLHDLSTYIRQLFPSSEADLRAPLGHESTERACATGTGELTDAIIPLLQVPYHGATKESPLSVWRQFISTKEQLASLGLSSQLRKQPKHPLGLIYRKVGEGNLLIVCAFSHDRSARRTSAEMRETIEGMKFGDTIYPLRAPVEGIFSHFHGMGGEYRVREFGPYFTGRGETQQQAYRDWLEQVHVAFQELYRKRPFEMTEQERVQWEVLEQAIDVAAYERQTPLVLREIGRLVTARPDPYQLHWMDNRTEVVALASMPAEFARFKPGQWFEAIVERDRPTGRLRKVRHVQAIDSLEPMSGSELDEFWKELPTTATLPRSNRDWTKR